MSVDPEKLHLAWLITPVEVKDAIDAFQRLAARVPLAERREVNDDFTKLSLWFIQCRILVREVLLEKMPVDMLAAMFPWDQIKHVRPEQTPKL